MPLDINILYIHGYGGNGSSRTAQALRMYLAENYKIFEPCFPLDPTEALILAKEVIQTKGIDIVVASSLGAFTAFQLHGVPKIVINPCLYPSKELPKQAKVSEEILRNFSEMEKQFDEWITEIGDWDSGKLGVLERMWTYGVFSTNDELFSFKDEFAKHYGHVLPVEDAGSFCFSRMIEDTHQISVENIEKVIIPMIHGIEKVGYKAWDNELQDYRIYNGVNYNAYSVEDLRELAIHPNPEVRAHVASHRRTSTDILEKLASDEDENVRICVAINENTPIAVLEKLSENTALGVAMNKNTPVHILEKLSRDTDKWVLNSVAMNPTTPDNIVEKLLCDTISFIQNEFGYNDDAIDAFSDEFQTIASTRKFSDEMFEWLINCEFDDWALSYSVAQNENTPTYILEKLDKDKLLSDLLV